MRYYQPSEGHLDLCLLAHRLFRSRPADLPAASLRLAAAYYEMLGQPEPVTPAHPGYYCAMHELSAWDHVVVQQLRPAAVKRVRELRLGVCADRARSDAPSTLDERGHARRR